MGGGVLQEFYIIFNASDTLPVYYTVYSNASLLQRCNLAKRLLIRASAAFHKSGSFVCSTLTNSHKQRLGKDVKFGEASQRGGEVASDKK